MIQKKQYVIISPDGFTIHPTDTYTTKKQMRTAFAQWKNRFKKQGYYSSNNGRIELIDLADNCTWEEAKPHHLLNQSL